MQVSVNGEDEAFCKFDIRRRNLFHFATGKCESYGISNRGALLKPTIWTH